ncbi:dihydropteroate synthase [Kwoniella bestiolae CBS 10118]|uniref:Dihydropteroate synthase n=1 Tax=Kwoniella bestiolae CBS 10118 TaxID=1296100 RepID=A0A1B9GAD9_9TREE|nr:dihydropteroate synthase [Kwoniella bestiolae CBS 10118]OCF27984.1 dihydropteroate synthase [Kwoniella bestiolae CBS 10118]
MTPDSVNLRSLSIHLPNGLGPSAFNLSPPPPCPIILNVSMKLRPGSIVDTATGDSMDGLGVNYSAVSKAIYALVSSPIKTWNRPWTLMREVSAIPLGLPDVNRVDVEVIMPKALLHADSAVYMASHSLMGGEVVDEGRRCEVRDIRLECVIGLHPHERAERQRLEIDVEVGGVDWGVWGHKEFTDQVYEFVSASSYQTIESLIHHLGSHLFTIPILSDKDQPASTLSITIRKPSAIPYAVPSITIHRDKSDYPSPSSFSPSGSAIDKRIFIAVGSNIGDRVDNIHKAIRELQTNGCELRRTSRLYESEPMYVEDQDRFINGVIEISTSLSPLDLLRLLKRTEKSVGRTKTFTNGPRVIDLDLVFYGEDVVRIGERGNEPDEDGVGWLECPHKSLGEREFVLRPLADIAPSFVHPSLRQTIHQLLSRLPTTTPPPLQPIIPFSGPSKPLRLSSPSIPYIMSIFNATPDSFSDGDPARTDPAYAIKAVEQLFERGDGPDILDIGGMSTRPGSDPCTEEEEINRVVPLIKAIRTSSNPKLREVPISIDTYRASVAKLAVEAGASMINDVRGGTEPGMLEVMAHSKVPVVLMHSRGDSKNMSSSEMTDYASLGGVVQGVKRELTELVNKAIKTGVKRWNIILDPGLGFAKTHKDNLILLRRLPDLLEGELKGYPMLVGGSRKGFVGKTIGRDVPSERGFGDAALNAHCVWSGVVDVLRVHSHRETRDTVKMGVGIRDA